jgi:PAS domain S-box-containing protein
VDDISIAQLDAEAHRARIREVEREIEALRGELHDERARSTEIQDFLERSAEGLHTVGADGTILWANDAELAMLGYAREEFVGRNIAEFHVEADVIADILERLLKGETLHNRAARLRCSDGTIKHVVVSSNGMFRNGDFVCMRFFTRDVTREREAEVAQARLAAIVESSDDAIISKTLDGVITSWNAAAERLYGWTAAEMVGASVLKIVPPEIHSEEDTIIARIRSGKRIDHYQTVRVAKDGSRREVSITVSPVQDASGKVIGASKIARDISAQLEAQRRKDQFLAILAHELRNPLAPIRNAISVFKQDCVTPDQRRRAQQIAERQTEHMARLLDDLLDVSRITTGRVELKRQRVELRGLLEHSVEAVKSQIDARGHSLHLALEEGDIWLDADPVRVQQIVANLLVNAAKYTDRGGRIELRARREGSQAVITVADNGIGFAPEMAPRLFQLFSQADGAFERAAGGLGIGLALVREFVERHGGSVQATSEGPSLGSQFTVRLPCEPPGALDAPNPTDGPRES